MDPLTLEDAAVFCTNLIDEETMEFVFTSTASNTTAVATGLLAKAVELATAQIERRREVKEEYDRKGIDEELPPLSFPIELYAQARMTAERDCLGGQWAYQDLYGFGERDGITEDQALMNDRVYTKSEQYWQLGDCEGNELDFNDAYKVAKTENVKYTFNQMYSFTRMEKGQEVSNNAPDMVQLEDGRKVRGPGVIKNSDYKIYLLRCEMIRVERTKRILEYIKKLPVQQLDTALRGIKAKYMESVKNCAPGPDRKMVDGQWVNVGLTGKAAIEAFKKAGVGSLKGQLPSKVFTYTKGEAWHNLLLKKEHLNIIENEVKIRKMILGSK
jgi:hypothetical protein